MRWQGHWHIYEQQHQQISGPSKWTIAPDGYQRRIRKALCMAGQHRVFGFLGFPGFHSPCYHCQQRGAHLRACNLAPPAPHARRDTYCLIDRCGKQTCVIAAPGCINHWPNMPTHSWNWLQPSPQSPACTIKSSDPGCGGMFSKTRTGRWPGPPVDRPDRASKAGDESVGGAMGAGTTSGKHFLNATRPTRSKGCYVGQRQASATSNMDPKSR